MVCDFGHNPGYAAYRISAADPVQFSYLFSPFPFTEPGLSKNNTDMRTDFNYPFRALPAVFILLTGLFVFQSCGPREPINDPDQEEWMSLFNGVNLDGWDIKINGFDLNDNYQNTFYVEDSLIKVHYDGYPEFTNQFGHLFYKEPFSYYRIRVEYRFVGDQAPGGPGWAYRNSGIMFHGQPAATMGKNQDFPISLEAQLLGGDGEHDRHTLNLCTPGTNVVMHDTLETSHCIESRSKTYHGDQWVTAELLVLGDSLIQHIMENEVVLQYSKPQIGGGNVDNIDSTLWVPGKILTGGSISLQSESHPVHFRKVELLNLEGCTDPKAKNYKSYYVKSDNSACVY